MMKSRRQTEAGVRREGMDGGGRVVGWGGWGGAGIKAKIRAKRHFKSV
jgi:hypothetical protein